jgi:type II site-specific deoxyribonuclease
VGTRRTDFERDLKDFVSTFREGVSTSDGEWTIKGFIDVFKNVYTISGDTKIVSKILEIHLFPLLLKFADDKGYSLVLADHQNYYPDMTFIARDDESRKFAVDLKTTYRLPNNPENCNGFTLGSHGQYFIDRTSRKNIQFPYSEYDGHFCLGIVYDRAAKGDLDETRQYAIEDLESITSVISNMQFFVAEKWKIASDRSGSGNTANIGSIRHIEDLLAGRGVFSELGEQWFDDYWMNYGKITVPTADGGTRKITGIEAFVNYRGGDVSKIVKRQGGKRIRVAEDSGSSHQVSGY